MTSKVSEASPEAMLAHKERVDEHYHIAAGLLPGIDELYAGSPFYGASIKKDMQTWSQSLRIALQLKGDADQHLLDALQLLHDTCDVEALEPIRKLLEARGHPDAWRVRVYQACHGVDDAARDLVHDITDSVSKSTFEGMFMQAVVIGLLYGAAGTMTDYCRIGMRYMRENATMLDDYDRAVKATERAEAEQAVDDFGLLDAIEEDRAEISAFFEPTTRHELIVVPQAPVETAARKDVIKSWGLKIGTALPLVTRGDVAEHRRSLVERWPHAAEIIDIVLSDLAAREVVRFRPTLFVGDPGSGKSSLARAILEEVGLPCELQSLAGVHDAALMGTSAQWASSRESAPLQLIKRSGMASVGIIWDEVEKCSTSSNNGSPLDALLPMLEIDQARKYRDLALEVEVDLSAVSHFGTANSIDGIPAPLRDRMRILVMPTPTWQHLSTLMRQIVDRIARERGIDSRWFPPLAEDEIDLVRQAWPGGSIRKLTRIVTTIIDRREAIMGKC